MNRKWLVLLFLMPLLIACSGNKGEYSLTKYSRFMPVKKHEVAVLVHPVSNIFLFNDIITIDRAANRKLYSTCFMINSNMEIDDIFVDGMRAPLSTLTKFSADYYGKEFSPAEIDSLTAVSSIYEVELPPYDKNNPEVKIIIKYMLRPNKDNSVGQISETAFTLNGEKKWLPFTLDSAPATIRVETLPKYNVQINGKNGEVTENGALKKTTFELEVSKDPINIYGSID